jgi:hypothetical protein
MHETHIKVCAKRMCPIVLIALSGDGRRADETSSRRSTARTRLVLTCLQWIFLSAKNQPDTWFRSHPKTAATSQCGSHENQPGSVPNPAVLTRKRRQRPSAVLTRINLVPFPIPFPIHENQPGSVPNPAVPNRRSQSKMHGRAAGGGVARRLLDAPTRAIEPQPFARSSATIFCT